MSVRFLLMAVMFILSFPTIMLAAQKPDDREALSGLKTAKVIFDVRIADDLDKLEFNLKLFNETMEGMVAQGVNPEIIIAFRGPGVKLLTPAELDDEAIDLIRALKKKGVCFEVCSIAMRSVKADPAGLIPEVKLVANVFNSLIGYQNKGFAMIAIN
jgi:intracellular sulfur oxidation DsrE/DsrF family protein